MILPSMEFYYNSRSEELDVILPGSSRGTESDLIRELYVRAKTMKRSVVTFDYPFHERLEKKGFGDKVSEEVEALISVLEYCRADGYKRIRLLGKSLGGVVAAQFLSGLRGNEQTKFDLVILGYDLGWIRVSDFRGRMVVIQGSEDPFGGIELVKKDLERISLIEVEYHEIKEADHGFRNPKTGKPSYIEQVLGLIY